MSRRFLAIVLVVGAASTGSHVIANQTLAIGLNNAASFLAGYRLRSEKELQAAYSFEGTTWFGRDGETDTAFRFEKQGVLWYSYKEAEYRNGTWTRDGDTVYFEMNSKYREFKGNIKNDRIEGDSWNVKGKTWKTSIKRRPVENDKR